MWKELETGQLQEKKVEVNSVNMDKAHILIHLKKELFIIQSITLFYVLHGDDV